MRHKVRNTSSWCSASAPSALYVLGIAAFTGNRTLNNVGGWLLLATGVGQLYLSAATLINEMYRRRVLPVI